MNPPTDEPPPEPPASSSSDESLRPPPASPSTEDPPPTPAPPPPSPASTDDPPPSPPLHGTAERSIPAPADPLTADRESLREPARVSPLGPVFLAWAVVRQLGFINIGIFTAIAGSGNFRLLGLVGSAALLVIGVARWLRFTYALETTDEGDQLVTLAGVFGRTRTSVPLDRVQAVSTRQNLLHRVFGLVEVNVQTAGSIGAEVQLTAVRPEVADRLRRLTTVTRTSGSVEAEVFDESGAPPPPSGEPILRRSTADVLRIALTRNPIVLLAPIPLAIGLGIEADDLFSGVSDDVADFLGGIGGSVLAVIVLSIVVVLVSAAVSVGFVVLRLHDLRLFVDGAGLRRLSGLISRTELTASVERVQAVTVQRNPLERLIGQHDVGLPLAGAAANMDLGAASPSGIDLPGSSADEVDRIAEIVFGASHGSEVGHDEQHPISPLAVRRWTLWQGVVPSVLVGAPLVFVVGWWAALALVWIAVAWSAARLRVRSWRWSLGPETLRVSSGVVTRSTRAMPVRKAQNVTVRRGIFHRRNGLADLRVRTAGRLVVTVPMIPVATARALRDELLYRTESDPRPFM